MKECNCGNYKPYIETMKPGVGYAPMMPFNACVNCYGEKARKEHLTDLQQQNDELRARAASLEASMSADINKTGVNFRLQAALDESPTQSLADIRAEAVLRIIDLDEYVFAEDGSTSHTVKQIQDHANRIKEG